MKTKLPLTARNCRHSLNKMKDSQTIRKKSSAWGMVSSTAPELAFNEDSHLREVDVTDGWFV